MGYCIIIRTNVSMFTYESPLLGCKFRIGPVNIYAFCVINVLIFVICRLQRLIGSTNRSMETTRFASLLRFIIFVQIQFQQYF
jgi:hypothetical protein